MGVHPARPDAALAAVAALGGGRGRAGGRPLLASPRLASLARSRVAGGAGGRAARAGPGGRAGRPCAYAPDTVSTTYTGSIPSAGPERPDSAGSRRRRTRQRGRAPGRARRAGWLVPDRERHDRRRHHRDDSRRGQRDRYSAWRNRVGRDTAGRSGSGGTAPGGTGSRPGGSSGTGSLSGGTGTASRAGGFGGAGGPGGSGGGGAGGLAGNTTVSKALVKLLEQDASKYKWVAATEGSEGAARSSWPPVTRW